MSEYALFSQYYFQDTTRHEDTIKFRNRILLYLEDVVNSGWRRSTYDMCRYQFGISIEQSINRDYLFINETFNKKQIEVALILDFISIVHDSLLPKNTGDDASQARVEDLILKVNKIFKEESMCYVLTAHGRVRYYPDEEFHQAVKCTLSVLSKPKYASNLTQFNLVLDKLYESPGTENPLSEFFKCIETFALSIVNDKRNNKLDESTIDKLKGIIDKKITNYAENDIEALDNFPTIFKKWVKMSHKYRHGKPDQANNNVPTELFNLILSMGISIFRFLLELDDKYALSDKSQ